jgi:hypothetical protein
VAAGDSGVLLGFDVADSGMLSGLTNCGYDDVERRALPPRWRRALNDYHLFQSYPQAERFRRFFEERVPVHAPFYVYSLRFIEARGGAAGAGPLPPPSVPGARVAP